MRDRALRGAVLFGTAVLLLTELLSSLHLLRRGSLLLAWALIGAGLLYWLYRRGLPTFPRIHWHWVEAGVAAAVGAIVALVGLAAWLSPPNSYDAMAYHMPRVVYWAQAGSVAFFPTPYFNQVSFPPLAEYLMLHTYVLSGGDRFVNLVATSAFAGSIMCVSAVAGAMGLRSRGQALAALFCATLPNAILQASGAKNDSLLAFWLVVLIYFALRGDARFTALSLALALATKGTAYVFAPALLLGSWVLAGRPRPYRTFAWIAAACIVLNGPQYIRNIRLSGSPLGFDAPFADGRMPWRNAHPGWRSTVSNALRNLSDQLGTGSDARNQKVFQAILSLHRSLGLDPQSRDTTWNDESFAPPSNTRHEANANNRWHLLILVTAVLCAIWRDRRWLLYGGSLALSFLLFCFWLRWQPYGARLLLPLFVAAAPLGGFVLSQIRPRVVTLLICLFLADTGRLPALENWTRRLRGPGNLFVTPRDENYFNDIRQHHNEQSYRDAVDLVYRSGCERVGIDITFNQLEYPFQALLRDREPDVRFVHTGYAAPPPCAVLCLDCVGRLEKLAQYGEFGTPITIGKFLLFLPPRVILPPK